MNDFDKYVLGLASEVGNGYASLAAWGFDIDPDVFVMPPETDYPGKPF